MSGATRPDPVMDRIRQFAESRRTRSDSDSLYSDADIAAIGELPGVGAHLLVLRGMTAGDDLDARKRPAGPWDWRTHDPPDADEVAAKLALGHGVGIVPGLSGMIGVDIDEADADLVETVDRICREHPPALCYRTSGQHGGFHLAYHCHDPPKGKRTVRRHGAKVELFGRGNHQLAIHRDGGEAWLDALTDADAPAPEWVLDAFRSRQPPPPPQPRGYAKLTKLAQLPKRIRRWAAKAVQRVHLAPAGERNDTLNRSAHGVFRLCAGHDVDPAEHYSALFDAALEAGLDDGEIRRTLDSALAAAEANPKTLPDRSPDRSFDHDRRRPLSGRSAEQKDDFDRAFDKRLLRDWSGDPPLIGELIPGTIFSERVNLITGGDGTGKTSLAVALAHACHSGAVEWLAAHDSCDTPLARGLIDHGPALIVSWEETRTTMHHKIAAIAPDVRDRPWLLPSSEALWTEDGVTAEGRLVAAGCERHGIRLLVLDGVGDALAGSESDRGTVSRFLTWANGLADYVVAIGHRPKSGVTYSGSTAWPAKSGSFLVVNEVTGQDGGRSAASYRCDSVARSKRRAREKGGAHCATCWSANGKPIDPPRPCPRSPAAGHVQSSEERRFELTQVKSSFGARQGRLLTFGMFAGRALETQSPSPSASRP